jgi:hypothetical protein
MFLGFIGFLVCIGLFNSLKELSKLFHHFSQLSNIFLCFLNGCMGWLAGIGGCEESKFMPKLETGILQSNNDFVGFLPKD